MTNLVVVSEFNIYYSMNSFYYSVVDPCPISMSYVDGSILFSKLKNLGGFKNVESVAQCYDLCSDNYRCKSFEFSKIEKNCNLFEDVIESASFPSRYKDYIVCTEPITKPVPEPCELCSSCGGQRKEGRDALRVTNTPQFWAEYYGVDILKIFQMLAVNPLLPLLPLQTWRVLPNQPLNQQPANPVLVTNDRRSIVYLYFMCPAGVHLTNFPTFNYLLYGRASADDNIIPLYLGQTFNRRTRYGNHLNDHVRDNFIRKSNYQNVNHGIPFELYYTHFFVRDDFDSELLERIFLDTFNFMENDLKNHNYRRRHVFQHVTGYDMFPIANPAHGPFPFPRDIQFTIRCKINTALLDNARRFRRYLQFGAFTINNIP